MKDSSNNSDRAFATSGMSQPVVRAITYTEADEVLDSARREKASGL
jgi:hypothetical protein